MSNKELSKELRCIANALAPVLTPEKLQVLEEAGRRLTKPGGVSTAPEPSNKVRKKSQGNRTTKKQVFNKYYNK